ncbi:MAG: hypothetical protein QXD77_00075 [Candidatus Aenigmatarchaeota archaeon]
MKGAIGIPTEILVGIVIAVILILAALVFFGVIPGIGGQQADRGYFESCCIAYGMAGHCAEGQADPNFPCTTDRGKVSISALASRAGLSVESCCRK